MPPLHGSLLTVWTRAITGFLAATVAATLAGCQPTVRLEPAEAANTVECANMMVRLPDTVDGLDRRRVDAQSTAAWGSPTAVLIRCGVPRPGPSTLPCVTVDGVDWLIDESDSPRFVFTTYGLEPATEVIVDSDLASGTAALRLVSGAVAAQSAPVASCLDATDVLAN
jgi:hypothetical protein